MLTHQTESFDFKPHILPLLLVLCTAVDEEIKAPGGCGLEHHSDRADGRYLELFLEAEMFTRTRDVDMKHMAVVLTQVLRANTADRVCVPPQIEVCLGQVFNRYEAVKLITEHLFSLFFVL